MITNIGLAMTLTSIRKNALPAVMTVCLLSSGSVLADNFSGTDALFAFNHFGKQLGAGANPDSNLTGRFAGEYHSYDGLHYGGIGADFASRQLLGNRNANTVVYYGGSLTENSDDYDWQLDMYITAAYEIQFAPSTDLSLGVSASFNGLPYRMFFNDSGNKVATGYTIGPVVGVRHIAELSQGVTLAPFGHYFYSSQSVSSRSLWNIFADAFSGEISSRSEHDFRDVWVAGVTLDANQLLITPSYVRSNNAESWHLSVGVNF